nr:hypothetical protein P5665_21795 [Bacillus subtilis]
MVTYSSYLPKTQNIPRSAASIVLMNIIVTLLAGLAIFPAVFSFGFQPNEGPTLLFTVLPVPFLNSFRSARCFLSAFSLHFYLQP